LHWLQHIQASGHGDAHEMYHKWTEGAHSPETLVREATWDVCSSLGRSCTVPWGPQRDSISSSGS